MAGKFIVFEGPDGSGQTTQANLLKKHLEEKGDSVVLTKEPTLDSDAGQRIHEVLEGAVQMQPEALQEFFVEDRREHLENVILPALREGKTVISDRYFFSTFAYGSLDCDMEWLIKINSEFPVPDITFILDVRPEVCIERIQKRGEGTKFFEKLEKLRKVVAAYKTFPERFAHVHLVNGEQPVEKVFEDIKEKLEAL